MIVPSTVIVDIVTVADVVGVLVVDADIVVVAVVVKGVVVEVDVAVVEIKDGSEIKQNKPIKSLFIIDVEGEYQNLQLGMSNWA